MKPKTWTTFLLQVLSIKLWFVLTSLKKIEAFLKLKQEEGKDPKLIIKDYIKALSAWKINDNIINRTNLEKYLLSAAFGFPYQHSMMYKALGQGMKEVKPGKYPSVFTVICGSVFGQRFAVCAGFCSFCGKPKPENQCGTCKVSWDEDTKHTVIFKMKKYLPGSILFWDMPKTRLVVTQVSMSCTEGYAWTKRLPYA